jgi:hypothetical protein
MSETIDQMDERAARGIPRAETPPLVRDKLAAFDQMEPEFEGCFAYVQRMHGERRFPTCAVADSVRYLHALWVCERKDRLLSVPKTIERYEGRLCLELLRGWQETGEVVAVVAFLRRKLDTLDFTQLTRELEAERRQGVQDAESARARRLAHGRAVLLNRGVNLLHALDALFTLPPDAVRDQARAACASLGHAPAQIAEHLREMDTPLLAFVRHPALAQRNMVVMDRLGMRLAAEPENQPGKRTARVAAPTLPSGPYAEQVIAGYVALTAPRHNNPRDVRWVDHPEPERPETRH